MKRLIIVLIVALIVPGLGCQRMRRGARCRPGLPTYNQPAAQAPYGGCTNPAPAYPPSNAGYPGAYAPPPMSGAMSTGPIQTEPMEGQVYTQQRPVITDRVVSGPVMTSQTPGGVITIPGPESAPLPGG